MLNIKSVSDLSTHPAIIDEVAYGKRLYLARNGRSSWAIIDIKELEELDRQKALNQLLCSLRKAEQSVETEGMVSADDLEAELGVL